MDSLPEFTVIYSYRDTISFFNVKSVAQTGLRRCFFFVMLGCVEQSVSYLQWIAVKVISRGRKSYHYSEKGSFKEDYPPFKAIKKKIIPKQ